jgi:predicted HTH domain antitoxin
MSQAMVTLQDVLEITAELSPKDQLRLIANMSERLSDEQVRNRPATQQVVGQTASLKRAISLYQQRTITLERAAEMAGMTRWELASFLRERDISVTVEVPPANEMDSDLAAFLG